MLNQQDVLSIVRGLGLSCTIREREFRVNFRKGCEDTAYYTTDGQDAIDTAQDMIKRQPQMQKIDYFCYQQEYGRVEGHSSENRISAGAVRCLVGDKNMRFMGSNKAAVRLDDGSIVVHWDCDSDMQPLFYILRVRN